MLNQSHSIKKGFTLVELLIVIVVIAILATITIVAYRGMSVRATNTQRMSEVFGYKKLLEAYKAANGTYPDMVNTWYCLGTGYPDTSSDGIGDCGDMYYAPNRYSENTAFMALLTTQGTVGRGPRSFVKGGSMGVFVIIYGDKTTGQMATWIEGGPNDCPAPFVRGWDDGAGRLLCRLNI